MSTSPTMKQCVNVAKLVLMAALLVSCSSGPEPMLRQWSQYNHMARDAAHLVPGTYRNVSCDEGAERFEGLRLWDFLCQRKSQASDVIQISIDPSSHLFKATLFRSGIDVDHTVVHYSDCGSYLNLRVIPKLALEKFPLVYGVYTAQVSLGRNEQGIIVRSNSGGMFFVIALPGAAGNEGIGWSLTFAAVPNVQSPSKR